MKGYGVWGRIDPSGWERMEGNRGETVSPSCKSAMNGFEGRDVVIRLVVEETVESSRGGFPPPSWCS